MFMKRVVTQRALRKFVEWNIDKNVVKHSYASAYYAMYLPRIQVLKHVAKNGQVIVGLV